MEGPPRNESPRSTSISLSSKKLMRIRGIARYNSLDMFGFLFSDDRHARIAMRNEVLRVRAFD